MEIVKKRFKVRVPAMASIWYIGSSVLARGLGILATPVFTRLLSPQEYGLYPLYTTWLGVISVIVTLELSGNVTYRALQKSPDKKEEIISSACGLFLLVFVLFCIVYFTFNDFFNKITGLDTKIMSVMLLQILANGISGLYSARARYEYRYKSVGAITVAVAVLNPCISLLILSLTSLRATSRIVGSAIAPLLVAIPLFYLIIRDSRTLFNKEVWRFLLRFNLPLIPHYFAMSLILRIGEISIGRAFGTEALGMYSVAVSVGMGLTMVTGGLLSSLSPWILRKMQENKTEEIRELLLLSTQGLAAVCLLILACAPEIIRLLTPSAYHASLPAVYALELSVIPMFLSGALMTAEGYYERTAKSALPSIIAAVISSALAIIVLPKADYRMASVFVLISYAALTCLRYLSLRSLSSDRLLSVSGTAAALFFSAIYAALLFILRDSLALRIIAALPVVLLAIALERKIFAKIRE